MIKKFVAIAGIMALGACSGGGAVNYAKERHGSMADTVTTGVTMAAVTGAVETNPILNVCGNEPVALVACSLGGKAVVEEALVASGMEREDVVMSMNTFGYFGACNNMAVLIGAATPAALIMGAICATAYYDNVKNAD